MFARLRPAAWLVVPFGAALLIQSGCTCGTGPYEGDYFDGDRPDPMQGIKYDESEKGDPKIVGCADGQREGFANVKRFPRIAACVAKWDGSRSLRDKGNGKPCGDDGERCDAPADVCSEGWHVCGTDGKADDLKDRVKVKDCNNAGPGRFNAGMSHGQTDELCPPKPTARTVFPCTQAGVGSEAVCCGNDCQYGKCKDGVWTGKTKISRGTTEGCGAVTSDRNAGVLCCYDGPGKPADDLKAADTKAEGGTGADGKAEGGTSADGKADADADGKADGKDASKAGDKNKKKAGDEDKKKKEKQEKKEKKDKKDKGDKPSDEKKD